MSEYTPTTDDVRKSWVGTTPRGFIPERVVKFYCWLDRVKAKAWEEGRESLAIDAGRPVGPDGMRPATPNPYKEDTNE